MNIYKSQAQQLELLMVKEEEKRMRAKRVEIVSLRLVKETSCCTRIVQFEAQKMATTCLSSSFGKLDRGYFFFMCLTNSIIFVHRQSDDHILNLFHF
ncbi:hypothetical protein MKZ26_17560 [Sporosarcina sp. FSL K6-6792]|uniref:hypothetical protein n=1 Tax=Sporosarcina sp. FSL K6-6792 TaxID=2921559 RepID=UPI0030F611B3